MSNNVIDLNNYRRVHGLIRRAHAEMLEEAAAAIERITGFGCQHERTAISGHPPFRYVTCRDCGKPLGRRVDE